MSDPQPNDNNTCVVCFKNVLFYSIGECDHPVCYECSTRMRVLCLQNECPICRQGLSRVVFTNSIQLYKDLRNNVFPDKLFERQFKIGFCSEEIKNAYERLLENRCKLCKNIPPFRSFAGLSDHMRKIHERFYCDLCVKHLKIFTFERKCYTRQELAHHRRKGDIDDTSHRGHPLCEFCEERFMDADELYRHLRKEHLYCHLCDADGRNQYYASHNALAHHFRTEHYLCEEGECAGQHLTAVFRTEIDLKAHKASVHGRGLARAAARQARTLELQFNITPHPVVQRVPRDNANNANNPPPPISPLVPAPNIDTDSVEQFPRLSSAPPAPVLLTAPVRHQRGSDSLTRDDKNFPALDGCMVRPTSVGTHAAPRSAAPTVAATLLRNTKPSVSIQLHSQPTSASNFRLTQASGSRISIPPQQKRTPLSDDDFPSLSMPKDDHPNLGAAAAQPPKVALINNEEMQSLKNNNNKPQSTKKQQLSQDAFPALSSNIAPTTPPQWITVSRSKEKVKQPKSEAQPQVKETTFNPVADFPELPVNISSKNKSKKAIPAPVVQQSNQNENLVKANCNKKEKKKLNNNVKVENDYSIGNTINIDKKSYKDTSASALLSNLNNNKEGSNVERKIQTVTESGGLTSTARNSGNDFAMSPLDYPPLNPKYEVTRKPNGILPESFKSKIMNGTPAAPPGLKPRPACDGLTFTNSAGQTFSAPLHTYIQPPNFENRNRALVKKFAAALGSTAAVEDFKVASRAFRDNMITADEFCQHCEAALGPHLDEVFPELVALLPDIGKQQELVVGRHELARLSVCSVCGQLLTSTDVVAHDAAHWPPLAAAR